VHTPRHIRKNSGFSTQEEHIVLLGLEALTKTPNLRYATRSILPNYTEDRQARERFFGFDHGVGHPLLLLYDAKAPSGRKNKVFKGLGHYA
jgi:hypothetical protein